MHEVLVNRLGGLSLSRKSAVSLTDRSDMTVDVYLGTQPHSCGRLMTQTVMRCKSCNDVASMSGG